MSTAKLSPATHKVKRCANTPDARARCQNIENNPMQSSRPLAAGKTSAGKDALPGARVLDTRF
jgi:hypothetical protein